MPVKTNHTTKSGHRYYKIKRKTGERLNDHGVSVPVFRYFYGKTKSEALLKFEDYKRSQQKPTADYTFRSALDFWINNKFLKSDRTDTTKKRYLDAFNNTLDPLPLLDKKLADIDSKTLQTTYNNLAVAPSTVQALHKLLKLFFADFEADGICNDITKTLVTPAVVDHRADGITVWAEEDLKKIISESKNHRLHFLFCILAGCGLRLSEALALQYGDFQGDQVLIRRQLQNNKLVDLKTNGSRRAMPLTKDLKREYRRHKKIMQAEAQKNGYTTDFIFSTSTGSHYDKSSLRKQAKRFYASIGVPAQSFHTFRHTYGTMLASSGVPIQTVSALLGHSDIATTSKYYVFVGNAEKQKAVAKLPDIF